MKRLPILLFGLLFVAACVTTQTGPKGITSDAVSTQPTAFCKVVKEPDPLLLGGWKCVHKRWVARDANYELDPVEFFLKKEGTQYAVYFYRSKEEGGDKTYRGWRDFKINGKEIVSETGVRFFVEGDQVFFSWNKEKPTPMTRIQLAQ